MSFLIVQGMLWILSKHKWSDILYWSLSNDGWDAKCDDSFFLATWLNVGIYRSIELQDNFTL